MPLEPRVAKMVKLVNFLSGDGSGMTIQKIRQESAALNIRAGFLVVGKGPEPAEQRDIQVPVAGGEIAVRLYFPHGRKPAPLYVFLHGGGWCIGTLSERDGRCREVSSGANCIVASVDYRLAPENAYPTAAEDTYAVLVWLVEHAEELGIDASRVAIGGESAGANLAAVTCLMARDRSGPAICHQWLDVPPVDLTMSQPSVDEVPDGYLLDMDIILQFRECYLGDIERAKEPYASPLFADDHSGLPPAWIMSCEYDKVRDDGVAYTAALKEAGVPVEFQILKGHVHPSFGFTRMIPSARAYERQAIAALARALHA